jgi:hypothetical protein
MGGSQTTLEQTSLIVANTTLARLYTAHGLCSDQFIVAFACGPICKLFQFSKHWKYKDNPTKVWHIK